jgi:uncharacterized membrane protein YgdD (TMEM256/DUF423 family)
LIRALVLAGALFGLFGIGLSALAAHRPGAAGLDTAARFLLAHGPVLLAAAALVGTGLVHRALGLAASGTVALGTALFAGDLTARALLEAPLAPMAAPVGGIAMMGGWLALGASAVLPGVGHRGRPGDR